MASADQYQQYSFNQELLNIDKSIDEIDVQLDIAIKEMEKLVQLSDKLKEHQLQYRYIWKKHNLENFNEFLIKAKKLDNILQENF